MRHMNSRIARMGTACLLTGSLVFSLAACGTTRTTADETLEEAVQTVLDNESASDAATSDATASTTKDTTTSLAAMSSTGVISTADLFTERDLAQVADTSAATKITVQSGQDVQVTQEGVYILTGEAQDVTITVEAPDDAAQRRAEYEAQRRARAAAAQRAQYTAGRGTTAAPRYERPDYAGGTPADLNDPAQQAAAAQDTREQQPRRRQYKPEARSARRFWRIGSRLQNGNRSRISGATPENIFSL